MAAITEARRWKPAFYQDVIKSGNHKREGCSNMSEKTCLTIVYNEGSRELNLVGPDDQTTGTWLDMMQKLIINMRAMKQEKNYFLWLKYQFIKADKDKTGALDFKQTLKLLDLINIKLSESYAKQLFEVRSIFRYKTIIIFAFNNSLPLFHIVRQLTMIRRPRKENKSLIASNLLNLLSF